MGSCSLEIRIESFTLWLPSGLIAFDYRLYFLLGHTASQRALRHSILEVFCGEFGGKMASNGEFRLSI